MSLSLHPTPASGAQRERPAARQAAGQTADARLAARFGAEVLAGGYTAVPNLVLRYAPRLGLSNGELLVIQYIWQHWWPAGQPHPSVAMLGRAMGKSPRMVRYYLRALQAKHLLVLEERFGADGNQQSNTYDLKPLIAAVVVLAQADGWNTDPEPGAVVLDQGLQPLPANVCPGGLQAIAGMKETPQDLSTKRNQLDRQQPRRRWPLERDETRTHPRGSVAGPRPFEPEPSLPATDRRQDPTYLALIRPLQALASELGDRAHPRVSLARAHNLFRQARLSQEAFLALLAEAAARTRAARPRLVGPRCPSSRRTGNLMPYLFATLEGLLEEEHEAWPAKTGIRPPVEPYAPSDRRQASTPPLVEGERPAHPIWDAVLAELRQVMTAENFRRWLAPTFVLGQRETMLVVAVPTELHKHWLAQRLHHLVDDALGRTAPGGVTVEYTVVNSGQGGSGEVCTTSWQNYPA